MEMATIEEAIQSQIVALMGDLLTQNARLLTGLGIDRQWRRHCKAGLKAGLKKLPPTDAVFAALILLRKEIVVEGISLGGGNAARYSIVALEQTGGSTGLASRESTQMSLLAGFDFSPGAAATIERAERKRPNRVELLVNVQLRPAVG
jgi:hypothetical protein